MHICAEYCELVREAAEFEDPRLAELRERMTRDDLFLLSYVIKRKRKHSRALAAWISARSAREKTAYHEAGHVVALLHQGIQVVSATIVPSDRARGRVQPAGRLVPKDPDLLRVFVEKEMICSLAGPLAEHMLLGRDVGTKTDDVRVAEFAEALYSDRKVMNAYLDYLAVRTTRMLTDSWHLVVAFADHLLRSGTLDKDEIAKVAVDAGFELPADSDEELDMALQDFLAQGEKDAAKAFVSGWKSARFMKFRSVERPDPVLSASSNEVTPSGRTPQSSPSM
jgi:hypothetical protein